MGSKQVAVILGGLVLGACSPAPAAKSASPADVAGEWTYLADAPALEPSDAPQIVVDGATIRIDGAVEGFLDIATTPTRINGVYEELVSRRKAWGQSHSGDFPGTVTMWVPKNTAAMLVKRLVLTAGLAGYPHVRLGVRRGNGKELGYVAVEAPPPPPVTTATAASTASSTASAPPKNDAPPPNGPNGRLAPEVIQKVVRADFGRYRRCYENGLRRDSQLHGRVSIKFVIDVDGHVSHAEDGGSELTDPKVIDCIKLGFSELVFPKPEGGIVTVVYPIIFSPGAQ